MNATQVLDRAIRLARRLPVFPCLASKKPATPHGFHDAVQDPAAIEALWRAHPGPLIGVPMGAVSGIDILDVDPRHGGNGWLRDPGGQLPLTRTHQTPRGGWHLLLRHAAGVRNSASKIAPGVDTRGCGGYAIWWPAAGYAVQNPKLLADWPDWLLELALPPPSPPRSVPTFNPLVSDRYVDAALRNAVQRVAGAADGTRNTALNCETFALARFVIAGALDLQHLADAMAVAAHAAGLNAREIELTIASALRAGGVP